MEEFVTVDDRDWKQKLKDKWEDGKRKTKEAAEKLWENREVAIPVAIAALTAVSSMIKGHNRRKELEEAEIRRERAFYDRSLGVYWETRRPLTTNEMLEVEERKKAGESIGAILDDMGLLKKRRR